ncbi:hypothetical protein JHD50_12125 [Sulfurimonas sp. MAG313]|nr:hypothetical protein [Sulfurimonas sp. MAG313]MDF1882036.1 hypothetical protein [Sulfurimonas sp. MAG313]
MSSLPNTLNSYWLWKEMTSKLGISNGLYKSWKYTPNMKLNNKYVFLQKNTLPIKYEHAQEILTDLTGYLPIRYASDCLHVHEHTFNSSSMKLYNHFEYKYVEDVKFVNIKRFFKEHGIDVKKNDILQLGKINKLDIGESSTFHLINQDYALVIN